MLSIRTLFVCDCALQAIETMALGAYALKFPKRLKSDSEQKVARHIQQWRIFSPLVMGALYLAGGCASLNTKYRFELIMKGAGEVALSYGRWRTSKNNCTKNEFILAGLIPVFYLSRALARSAFFARAQVFAWQGAKPCVALNQGFSTEFMDRKFLTHAFAVFPLPIGKLFIYYSSFVITYLIEIRSDGWIESLEYGNYSGSLASLGALRLGCLFFIQKHTNG